MNAMIGWAGTVAAQAAVLLAASWLGAALLRRAPAAARHQIWTLGAIGALSLPILCWVIPSMAPAATVPTLVSNRSFIAAPVMITSGGTAASPAAPTWPMWLALVWAAGTLVVALRAIRDQLAARRLMRAASRIVPATCTAALHEAAATLALTTPVELRLSDIIGSPMTVGVARPRVLLPSDAVTWSPERLRAVLLHELGHVRRRDTLVQLIAQLTCALYWWNPLTWLAAARLRREREHACDDLVLGAGVLPSSYATELLDVARAMTDDTHAHAGASCMVERGGTEARVRRILDTSTSRAPLRTRFRLGTLGLAAAATLALACSSSAPTSSASTSASTSPPPRIATATAPPASAPRPTLPPSGGLSVGEATIRTPVDGEPALREPFAARTAPSFASASDLQQVGAEVDRRTERLAQCYQRRLAARPGLAGTITVHWVIADDGAVPDTCITEDTTYDRGLVDCVNQLVNEGPFTPPSGGAIDVEFPFVFTPPA